MSDHRDPPTPGGGLVRLDAQVTLGFGALTAATHLLAESLDLVYAVVSSLLFAAGIGLFLLGFWNGIQRSRIEDVSLAGLLAVDASFVTAAARNRLWSINVAQIVIAVSAASLRPFTQQAFGLLVPMFGVGIAALWGSRYAAFHPRTDL